MPALALISGYFSKSGPPTRAQLTRLVTDILLPYVIFETLWTLVRWAVKGQADPNPTTPSWTLWFLLALGVFRLLLPYLALLRAPLVWTLAVSLGVGFLPNIDDTFALMRALALLPFFTFGWWLREHDVVDRLRLLRRPWWTVAAAIAVLAAAVVIAATAGDLWREVDLRRWLFYDLPYAQLGVDAWWAAAVRLALIALAVVLSAAFFVLVPRTETWWTPFGRATMYVYLLHTFVLYPFRESGVLSALEPAGLWLPVVVAACVLVALALATAPVRRVFRPLVEPRAAWLFRPEAVR